MNKQVTLGALPTILPKYPGIASYDSVAFASGKIYNYLVTSYPVSTSAILQAREQPWG